MKKVIITLMIIIAGLILLYLFNPFAYKPVNKIELKDSVYVVEDSIKSLIVLVERNNINEFFSNNYSNNYMKEITIQKGLSLYYFPINNQAYNIQDSLKIIDVSYSDFRQMITIMKFLNLNGIDGSKRYIPKNIYGLFYKTEQTNFNFYTIRRLIYLENDSILSDKEFFQEFIIFDRKDRLLLVGYKRNKY